MKILGANLMANPKRRAVKKTAKKAAKKTVSAYVKRPSQITKKAPSARLKKRRTMRVATGFPKGTFPNPGKRKVTGYEVVKGSHVIGVAASLPKAKAIATGLANLYGVQIGIRKV
jgi:deoxyribose-phosphate aldolase